MSIMVPVSVSLCAGASAQPGRAIVAGHDSRRPADELPPVDSVENSGFTAVVGVTSATRVAKAGFSITLPKAVFAAYANPKHYHITFPRNYVRAETASLPHPQLSTCDYYYSGTRFDVYAVDVRQPDGSKPGVITSVGVLKPIRVSFLAFGAIPVTATLRLTQVIDGGRPQPLLLYGYDSAVSVPKGTYPNAFDLSNPPQDCDPEWAGPNGTEFLVGKLNLTVTDVQIDKRRLDIGNSCRSATPLAINATARGTSEGGQYDGFSNGGILNQQRNSSFSAEARPKALYPNSSNLTIPPFAGCRTKTGEDVSRLLTGLASGPNNTLAVNQGYAVAGGWDPSKPSLCADFQGCVTYPAAVRPPALGR